VGGTEVINSVLRNHIYISVAAFDAQPGGGFEKLFNLRVDFLIALDRSCCFLCYSEDRNELVRGGVEKNIGLDKLHWHEILFFRAIDSAAAWIRPLCSAAVDALVSAFLANNTESTTSDEEECQKQLLHDWPS